jgi:hypothetical protein
VPRGDEEDTVGEEEERKSASDRPAQEGSDPKRNEHYKNGQSPEREAEFQASGVAIRSPGPLTGHSSRESSTDAEDIPHKDPPASDVSPTFVSGSLRVRSIPNYERDCKLIFWQPLKVTLTDHRKISSPSDFRIRILVQVEEYCNGDTLVPETWFVHADKLIEVLQASPTFVDGMSHTFVLLTGDIKTIFKVPPAFLH